MTKAKITIANLVTVVMGYILPIVILNSLSDNYQHIYLAQIIVLSVILIGGILLTSINIINRRKFNNSKILFITPIVLGIIGISYSLVIFYFIFAFKNGLPIL